MRRTNIVIDEVLVHRVMKLLGVRTIRQAVHLSLTQTADRAKAYEALRNIRGRFHWEGDIDAWRRSRQ